MELMALEITNTLLVCISNCKNVSVTTVLFYLIICDRLQELKPGIWNPRALLNIGIFPLNVATCITQPDGDYDRNG